MNEKITLPTLVSLLADKTGKQKKQCEDFLREFFNTLSVLSAILSMKVLLSIGVVHFLQN